MKQRTPRRTLSRLRSASFSAFGHKAGAIVALMIVSQAFVGVPTHAEPDAAATDAEASKPVVSQPVFPVTEFKIAFDQDVTALDLDAEKLKTQPIKLAQVGKVYTRPQLGATAIETSLAKLTSETAAQYDVTALRAIIDDLLAYLADDAGLIGIIVAPAPTDIGLDLSDRREGRTELTLVIRLAKIGRVRTLASGDRVDLEEREDNPIHQSIRERSPLQPDTETGAGSFVVRTELDDYLYRLNRHPGRRVDAAVSPGLNPGEISLDYLVTENKPWFVYFQLSNTGTDSTETTRERFGFVHNQLTGKDDILTLDYVTTGFDESHIVSLSYTRPLTEHLEARFTGLYSTFTADQVGSPLSFTGEDAAAGAALAYNFYQDGPLFFDAVAGLEYYFTSANNPGAATEGEAHFLLGKVGLEMERVTDLSRLYGMLMLMGNLNQVSLADLSTLGRTSPSEDFLILQYALTGSIYLEPVLNREAWEDLSDPSTSTLAHELAFLLRGQWAVDDDRFVPTFQTVAGGLYTVRGYEQADVAGDSSIIATLEYRFHVPRIFGIEAPRQTQLFDRPFRVAPDAIYGKPDWDLILKAFIDYAYVDVSNELAFETDDTLLGTGLGIELALKNNVNIRVDWGVALQDAGSTQSGDSRIHFVLTLLY